MQLFCNDGHPYTPKKLKYNITTILEYFIGSKSRTLSSKRNYHDLGAMLLPFLAGPIKLTTRQGLPVTPKGVTGPHL